MSDFGYDNEGKRHLVKPAPPGVSRPWPMSWCGAILDGREPPYAPRLCVPCERMKAREEETGG